MPKTKLILTNEGALRLKYGDAGLATVKAAVDALVAADKARDITTSLVRLDVKEDVEPLGAKPVTGKSQKSCKDAVDAVCKATSADFVMLLGASDVVPQQSLDNPLRKKKSAGDADPEVPSDLPYASAAPYSRDPRAFLAPSRVVARLPDLVNARTPEHLVALLQIAAGARVRTRREYDAFFAVSAKVWTNATKATLRAIFGASKGLALSPKAGPAWTPAELEPRSHLINCHGLPGQAEFYGQEGDDFPVAHQAARLAQMISDGTVVAAECCYGAELYDPAIGLPMGICHAYLREGAYGFLGSSTIAYGCSDPPTGAADLLCQYFLELVLQGVSIGGAVLGARQRFVKKNSPLDPFDLKTVAQFDLFGDPSLRAVASSSAGRSSPGAKTLRSSKGSTTDGEPGRAAHERAAAQLAATTFASVAGGPSASTRVRTELAKAASARGLQLGALSSFVAKAPPSTAPLARKSASAAHALRGGKARPKAPEEARFYVAFAKASKRAKVPTEERRFTAEVVYVAREFGGKVQVRELQQKGDGAR
jgi:hypothetical protein